MKQTLHNLQIIFFSLLVFLISGKQVFAQPANDDPCNATFLVIGPGPLYATTQADNNLATISTGIPDPYCGDPNYQDIWYRFLVPPTGAFSVDLAPGTVTDAAMALYTGSCTSLVLLECNDDGSFNGDMPFINQNGLTPNDTIWLRVWSESPSPTGTFSIYTEVCGLNPLFQQDCNGGIGVCSMASTYNIGFQGTGEVTNEINTTLSCLGSGEKNSTWFQLNAQTAGDLNFIIQAYDSISDFDFAVFNITNHSCNEIFTDSSFMSRCNYSTSVGGITGITPTGSSTGTYSPSLPVLAGETFAILVNNFSFGSTSGFTIDFSASTAIIDAPQVDAAFNYIASGSTVEFTNTSQHGGPCTWDFGDGVIDQSGISNPRHTYPIDGTYNVCMIACNGCSSDTVCQTITISVGISPIQNQEFSIFPNPASDKATIHSNHFTEQYTFQLTDASGRIVLSRQITSGNQEIALNSITQGLYFYQCIDDKNMKCASGKMVVLKQ